MCVCVLCMCVCVVCVCCVCVCVLCVCVSAHACVCAHMFVCVCVFCVCVCVCVCVRTRELRIISPDKILLCINTFITIVIIILLYFPGLFPQEQWSVVHMNTPFSGKADQGMNFILHRVLLMVCFRLHLICYQFYTWVFRFHFMLHYF